VLAVVPIWLWVVGARLHDAIYEDEELKFWIEFPVAFYTVLGFLNALTYGTSHRFLHNWKRLLTCGKRSSSTFSEAENANARLLPNINSSGSGNELQEEGDV